MKTKILTGENGNVENGTIALISFGNLLTDVSLSRIQQRLHSH